MEASRSKIEINSFSDLVLTLVILCYRVINYEAKPSLFFFSVV